MPLYEYICRDCGKGFEMFVTAERTPACPACSGSDLVKLLSSPGMVGVAASRNGGGEAPAAAAPMPGMCGARGGRCGCA
jgi:putative FmdB family regulatory protein